MNFKKKSDKVKYFLNKSCGSLSHRQTLSAQHILGNHTHTQKKDCLVDWKVVPAQVQHGWGHWADLKTVTRFTAQCCFKVKYQRGDWVTVFNRKDNPCEHRCETFLICAALKLCHSYWKAFALNRRYRTVRNTSKEICYVYVSPKTDMTMCLIWKLNRK